MSPTRVAVALACLCLLAGCAAPTSPTPPDGTGTVAVSVANDHDAAYRVTVSVVPGGYDAVDVTYANGTTRRVAASSVDEIPRPALTDAVSFVPVGPGVDARTTDVPARSGLGYQFDDVPRNASVVYVVARPAAADTVRAVGVVSCGANADATDLGIVVRGDGTLAVSTHCRG